NLFAWPYSASSFWSSDRYQTGFIAKLHPSVSLLTEIEKEETLSKNPEVKKSIWDYSIDLIGPGERAQRQIELARENDLQVYLKSEPELAFEAPGPPQIPCQDRWWDRANALASAGTDGAWVFPFYQPFLGNTSGEIYKYAWWEPCEEKETLLDELAARISGRQAGPSLRAAWKDVSASIDDSPDMPPYYSGPYFLGPLHPLFADPQAERPKLYEHTTNLDPHFMMEPRGNVRAFAEFYRKMEESLRAAVEQLELADPLVPAGYQITYSAEAIPIRWFYHTVRTNANFYETHLLCRQLLDTSNERSKEANVALLDRLHSVLLDEKENALQAIPLLDEDPRLEVCLHARLPSNKELMDTKMQVLNDELNRFLPELRRRVLGDGPFILE
ncbi:MAG: hypothetical protein KC964_01540, partial [Candidatus Omnitrophica bacterium]|nr:hypothetical protein [Candidatus Omnitrophota bacterium]